MASTDLPYRRRDSSTSSSGSSILFLSQTDQDKITGILDDLEMWSPLLEYLRPNETQFQTLLGFMERKIDRLMSWGPIGTEEHQFDVLKRLAKLKEGSLEAATTLNEAIEQRLETLTENDRGEQRSGEAGCKVSCVDA